VILFVTVFGAANIYVKALNRVKQQPGGLRAEQRHGERAAGHRGVPPGAVIGEFEQDRPAVHQNRPAVLEPTDCERDKCQIQNHSPILPRSPHPTKQH
jgi:hypothetical protein